MLDVESPVEALAGDFGPGHSPNMHDMNTSDNINFDADLDANEPNGKIAPEEGITNHKEEVQDTQDAVSDEKMDEDLYDMSEVKLDEPSSWGILEPGNRLGQDANSDLVLDHGERDTSPSGSETSAPATDGTPSSLENLGGSDSETVDAVEEVFASQNHEIETAPIAPAARGFNNSYLSSFLRRSAATKTQKPEENITTEPQSLSTSAACPAPPTVAMKPANSDVSLLSHILRIR